MSTRSLRGTPASPGAALGAAWTRPDATGEPGGTPQAEAKRARRGLELAAAELAELVGTLAAGGHEADADIVETNRLMAVDPVLVEAAASQALAGAPAPAAIALAVEPHATALEALDDPLLAARAADIRSIARRAGELSVGRVADPPAGAILVADDIGPGEVAAWSGLLAAVVLARGGSTAHATIVARSLGVPLVTGVGAEILSIPAGADLGVDADRGIVWPSPDADTRARLNERMRRIADQAARDRLEQREPARTSDGRRITLLANAGTLAEVEAALAAGAEGIGLLRSELSFLQATGWPDEQQHAAALAPMLRPLGHRLATVRTLDFGGDKTPPFLADTQQGAGLLGPRGIRLALAAEGGVAPQLRALLRVAGDAIVRILVPMVTEAAELDAVREMALAARDDVAPGGADPLVGAMIEVPAAALAARALVAHADFVSIGTNDLVQYTLAADRLNPNVAERAVAYHPSVLRLIARVVTAAHAAGIPADVCGEAAGDPEVLPLLIGLGVDEISVSPARLASTRRLIRAISTQRAKAAVGAALAATTAAGVAAAARSVVDEPPLLERLEQDGDRVKRV